MAVAVRSTSGVAYGSRTNTAITAPTGIVNGDILLLFVAVAGASPPTPTFPAGFATVAGPIASTSGGFTVNFYCLWKRASGESGSYTVTHSSASTLAQLYCISGAKSSGSPINASSSNSGTGTTSTGTGITTTVNDCLIVFAEHDWGDTSNNLSPPSGTTPTFTERVDAALRYYAEGVLATAGATGNKSITNNNTTDPLFPNPWAVYLVAVEPAGSSHSHTATGITVSPVVATPAITQRHALTGTGIAPTAPSVGSPAVTQRHAFTPTGVATAAPSTGSPAIVQVHGLTATGIATTAPTVGSPAISQAHALAASAIATGAPTVGSPAPGQAHSLTASAIATGAPSAGNPTLSGAGSLSALPIATGAPSLGSPGLGKAHVLAASGITVSPAIEVPALAQRHALAGSGVSTGAPTVGSPASAGSHALAALGLTASPTVGSPAIGQAHALAAPALATLAPAVGSPAIAGNANLSAINIATGAPTVGTPALDLEFRTSTDRTVAIAAVSRQVQIPAAARSIRAELNQG